MRRRSHGATIVVNYHQDDLCSATFGLPQSICYAHSARTFGLPMLTLNTAAGAAGAVLMLEAGAAGAVLMLEAVTFDDRQHSELQLSAQPQAVHSGVQPEQLLARP